MAFDIVKTNLAEKAEAGHRFEVKLPDGSPTDFYITVRGTLSPKVKAYGKKLFNQMQIKEQQLKRKGKEAEFSLEEAEEMAVDSASLRVITWEGLQEDGKDIPPTEDNIKRIMRELDWVRSQVLDESDIAANFI